MHQKLIDSEDVVLAVDPGKSGAIARIGRGKLFCWRDFKSFDDIALRMVDAVRDCEPKYLIAEFVHAMPGQGVTSMFSFGKATGFALGALKARLPGKDIEEVTPQKWQGYWRERYGPPKGTPFDSRALARLLFPDLADTFFRRKLDHNSADAALIGLWKLAQANLNN